MNSVELQNVWVELGGQTVLERINLSLGAGEFCAIVGPSGCGKTTLLRLLLSVEHPARGMILLGGAALPPEPRADRGVVFQRYSVFPHLRVIDNVMLGRDFTQAPWLARLRGAARRRVRADALRMLDQVGLAEAADKFPAQLSGGMQQRLALAQTLFLQPRLLLLDEPFGALDPGTRAQMHKLLAGLWREAGMTVVMVTHDLAEAFTLATRVVALDKTRQDAQAPGAFGASITYDIKVQRPQTSPA